MTRALEHTYYRERQNRGVDDAVRSAAAGAAGGTGAPGTAGAAAAAGTAGTAGNRGNPGNPGNPGKRRAAARPAPDATSSLLARLAGSASAVAANVAWAVTGWRRPESRWLQASQRSPWPEPPGRSQGSPGAAPNGSETADDRQRRQECAGLLSYLRAAIDNPVPTVVIAGAAAGAGTSRIADGLAEAARECGLRMFSAELGGTPRRPVLQQRRMITLPAAGAGDRRLTAGEPAVPAPGTPAADQTSATSVRFGGNGAHGPGAYGHGADGNGVSGNGTGGAHVQGVNGQSAAGHGPAGTSASTASAAGDASSEGVPPGPQHLVLETIPAAESISGLSRWFEQPGGSIDFILVEAPPLDTAADAALLARACDGLVLVVESAVTPRDSLRRAIRIAEASGCRVLGLAMSEPQHSLPTWLSRLLSGTSRGR